jgi:hypothetical protein
MNEIPRKFTETFLNKEVRERVAHEWKKRPEKLYRRVCHFPDELFKNEYLDKSPTIEGNEPCYILTGQEIKESIFSEADKWIGIGSGVLIITTSGSKFYAESEATKGHPYVSYAGG